MMTETLTRSEWLAANGEFLAASIAWIRGLLGQHGRARPAEPPGRAGDGLAALAAAVEDSARGTPPPALVSLAQRTGLTRFERDILMLCAAAELDPSIRGLYADVHGNGRWPIRRSRWPLCLLPDPSWDVLSPDGVLRYWRLIEVNQPAGRAPDQLSALRADERIVNTLRDSITSTPGWNRCSAASPATGTTACFAAGLAARSTGGALPGHGPGGRSSSARTAPVATARRVRRRRPRAGWRSGCRPRSCSQRGPTSLTTWRGSGDRESCCYPSAFISTCVDAAADAGRTGTVIRRAFPRPPMASPVLVRQRKLAGLNRTWRSWT